MANLPFTLLLYGNVSDAVAVVGDLCDLEGDHVLGAIFNDKRGNFASMTAIMSVPLMGALALGIDYTHMSRQRAETLHALDAAGIATARHASTGASDAELNRIAREFFNANLSTVRPANTNLNVTLPSTTTGGGTLKMSATVKYDPYFYGAFLSLLGGLKPSADGLQFLASTEVRLKNSLELALVLDNSGSMDFLGTGSGRKRIELLKSAAKELVDTLSLQAGQTKQTAKPVQVSLVPFAASVNVGSQHETASWMDTTGISPVHHENFDWTTKAAVNPNRRVDLIGGVYYKRGTGWGSEANQVMTRFRLFSDLRRMSGSSTIPLSTWGGCVEARPFPLNTDDAAPSSTNPATLFVPMFAPDETDQVDSSGRPSNNNWLADGTTNSSAAFRQRFMPKYYTAAPSGTPFRGLDQGPNASCSTQPLTTLTDIGTSTGKSAIKSAIDAMTPDGATNVAEGLAWGWRTVSSGSPFVEGRPETERGNDKVVIVLTDGANTYYTPNSVTAQSYSGSNWATGGNDLAGSRAIYSAHGYLAPFANPYTMGRLFLGTSSTVSKTTFSNANYSRALDEHLRATCDNAKNRNVIIMTVALDLDPNIGTTAERAAMAAQIQSLNDCASQSRVRPEKLFWNTKGGDLAETFRQIAEELSNLRIVG